MCFDKGAQKTKLDRFLIFFQVYLPHLIKEDSRINPFQLYIFTKEKLPMDIEFMLEDTLEVILSLLLCITY